MEGSRTVLAEVQAWSRRRASGARRNANGIDYNRASAAPGQRWRKRVWLFASSCDAYINVVGGLRLGRAGHGSGGHSGNRIAPWICRSAAIWPPSVRSACPARSAWVSHLNQRLSEIARLGFRRCIIPAHVRDDVQKQNGLQTIPVKNIREALKAGSLLCVDLRFQP